MNRCIRSFISTSIYSSFRFLLGGDPFKHDDEWLPAHKFCTRKCDIKTHLCMKAIKGDKERCDKLPALCAKGIKGL
ncbi:hypothetical protein AB6A40_003203 [Gnathostoma spinigerum]|uniref:Uncharacterized protein n=1 Tax=Gnathostoma spinigerum TaxID=75299 RepID=A0ABD6EEE1_9BILA